MNGRLSGLSSMATRHILSDLARDYESQTGVRVEIRSMGGVEAAKSVRAGEATDIVVLASKVMGALEAEGHIAKGGTRDFARSEIGVAVRAGSALPSLASEQAVKQAMLDGFREHLGFDLKVKVTASDERPQTAWEQPEKRGGMAAIAVLRPNEPIEPEMAEISLAA